MAARIRLPKLPEGTDPARAIKRRLAGARRRGPTEAEVQRGVLAHFKALGWPAWRFNSGAMLEGKRFVRFNTARGCSDVLFVAPGGRFGACECKRPGNEPTANQAAFLDAVRRAGGLALCVHSVLELEAALKEAVQ